MGCREPPGALLGIVEETQGQKPQLGSEINLPARPGAHACESPVDGQGARCSQLGSRSTPDTWMCPWSRHSCGAALAQNWGQVDRLNLAITSFLCPWGRQVSLPRGDPKPAQQGSSPFPLPS